MAWMAVIYPDSLISASFSLYEGKIADITMFRISGLLSRLDRVFRKKPRRYYLFGDKAYIYQRHVMSPYIGLVSKRKLRFNRKMASARVIVEYGFGRT